MPAETGDGMFLPGYRRGALVLLMLIYVFNFVDRQVVNIVAEAIKHDLRLSDGQLGAVTGAAFALFYSLLGLPVARLADRWDRPKIIAAAVAGWSAFTILCGVATSFTQLLLARIGVGIGEAGGVPPSHSLITEFTPRERRASSISLYQAGLPLGTLFGLALGGVIADRWGWRAAFFVAGAPGLALGLLALAVLREPRRVATAKGAERILPLGTAIRMLLAKPTYRWLLLGAVSQSLASYGIGAFAASFFLRNHQGALAGMAEAAGLRPMGYLGIWLGLVTGLGGAIGTILAGRVADRLSRRDPRAYATVSAIGALISLPGYVLAFLAPTLPLALFSLAIASAANSSWHGPVHASNQGLVPPNMRSTISAFTLVALNLIGLGLGPPLVGLLSDHFQHALGMGAGQSLRVALICSSAICAITVISFWRARRTLATETIG
jgi:MFS family permease